MLRGGIAGCGAVITTSHMPGWRALKDVEIVAVCDPREHYGVGLVSTDFLPSNIFSREEIENWKHRVRREVILNWHYIWSFLLEMRRITTRQAKLFLSLATGMKEGWR